MGILFELLVTLVKKKEFAVKNRTIRVKFILRYTKLQNDFAPVR